MKSVWYFAYGSNMNPARLIEARLLPAGVVCSERLLGRLDGWALSFDKPSVYFPGTAAANIAESGEAHVFGALNSMPEKGLEVLDRYENVATGHYERATVRVHRLDTGQTIEAVTYIARNNLNAMLKPRAAYLEHLLAGRDVLPQAYVEKLRAISVYEGFQTHA